VSLINYRVEGRVALIGMNRPEKRNALSDELRQAVVDAVERFKNDDSARVAILYGEGKSFCAGMDLGKEARANKHLPVDDRRRIQALAESWLKIWDCPKPVIAQVHGHCLAGGVPLAMCCDIVCITPETQVGWARLPMGAGWISPMWASAFGPQHAKLMGFRIGSVISGDEAHQLGFATCIFPADELASETMKLATDIARNSPDLLEIHKLAVNRLADRDRGFRYAVLAGAEWDALSHGSPVIEKVSAWIQEVGFPGAIERFETEGV
jgi:enoyl-CoA hydratase